MTSYETLWTCDKCKVKSFPSFEEAVEHENNCKGVVDDDDDDDDEVQIIIPPSQEAGEGSSSRPTASKDTAMISGATEEVWTCDKCNNAQFSNYDEAIEHEKMCDGATDSGKSATKTQVSPQPTKNVVPEMSFVCDVCKVAEFSTYEEAAKHEAKCSYGNGSQSKERNKEKSSTGTKSKMGAKSGREEPVKRPKHRQDRKQKTEVARTTVWTCDICKTAEFSTFEEAVEHEKRCDGSKTTHKKGRILMSSRDRERRPGKDSDPISRNSQKRKAVGVSSSGTPALIPLISDSVSSESMKLSPLNLLAMAQMDLASNSTGTGESDVRYELRCKHCSAPSKVNTLDTLHRGVYSMMYSHLLKTCPHIPSKVRESLQLHQRNKKSNGSIGLRQFCSVLVEKLRLREPKSATAGKEAYAKNVQHHLLGVSSEGKQRHTKQQRKRASESVSLNRSNKKSKGPMPGLLKTLAQTEETFCFEDEDGVKTILPPFGGVPLSSIFVSKKISNLSHYEQLLLGQLELVEDNKSERFLVVRCQSCKFHPSLRYTKPLKSIKGWHKVVEDMGDHVLSCSFLSKSSRDIIAQVQVKGTKGSESLESFCSYLADFFAMEDSSARKEDSGVVWGECPPVKPDYLTPGVRPEKVLSKSPSPCARNKTNLSLSADVSAPFTISNYAYLLAAQLQLVPVDRKGPVSSLGANEAIPNLRQRSRRHSADGPSSSPTASTPNDMQGRTSGGGGNAVGLQCRHCLLTKPVTNVTDLARSMPHNYYNHFKKCPRLPGVVLDGLDAAKALQGDQKSQFIKTLPEYCRQIIGAYGLIDLEWDGVCRGVAFRGERNEIKKWFGDSDTTWKVSESGGREYQNNSLGKEQSFVLPLLVKKCAKPVTADFVKIATTPSLILSSDVNLPHYEKQDCELPKSGVPAETVKSAQALVSESIPSEQPVYNEVAELLWKGILQPVYHEVMESLWKVAHSQMEPGVEL